MLKTDIKIGDVITNTHAVIVVYGIYGCPVLVDSDPLPSPKYDALYPLGDHWIVESILIHSHYLIHMSGKRYYFWDEDLRFFNKS